MLIGAGVLSYLAAVKKKEAAALLAKQRLTGDGLADGTEAGEEDGDGALEAAGDGGGGVVSRGWCDSRFWWCGSHGCCMKRCCTCCNRKCWKLFAAGSGACAIVLSVTYCFWPANCTCDWSRCRCGGGGDG